MLTQEEYRRMELELRTTTRSARSIARRFGVACATASKIRNRSGRVRVAPSPEPESASSTLDSTGEYRRCPECGALAKLPCAYCAAKREAEKSAANGRTNGRTSGSTGNRATGAATAFRSDSSRAAELKRRAESFRFVPLFATPNVVASAAPKTIPSATARVDVDGEPDFSLDLPPAAYARYLEVRRWRERQENPRFDVLPDDWPWRNEVRRNVGRYKRRKRVQFPRKASSTAPESKQTL